MVSIIILIALKRNQVFIQAKSCYAVLRAFISNFYKKSGIFQFFLIILDKR